jgi:hypothetical protein
MNTARFIRQLTLLPSIGQQIGHAVQELIDSPDRKPRFLSEVLVHPRAEPCCYRVMPEARAMSLASLKGDERIRPMFYATFCFTSTRFALTANPAREAANLMSCRRRQGSRLISSSS